MALDRTAPEFKHFLEILKHALHSIAFRCRNGLVANDASEIKRHVSNIREAADGLETLAGLIKEAPKSKERSNQGMTYAPGEDKP